MECGVTDGHSSPADLQLGKQWLALVRTGPGHQRERASQHPDNPLAAGPSLPHLSEFLISSKHWDVSEEEDNKWFKS